MTEWFAVDRDGLADLMARNGGAPRAVLELVANAWDAPGVTRTDVTLTPVPGKPLAQLRVVDDSPDGFTDLAHAFTLFARSEKITDAEKRGRFNLGEKLVLAVCVEAQILSTRGGVAFDRKGRHHVRVSRDSGSEFNATIRLTRDDIADVEQRFHTLIPPAGVTTTLNGVTLEPRRPAAETEVALRTEVAGDDGTLKPTVRKTTVRLFDPIGDETPHIYELGIPVVDWDCRWSADVGQKVPLNFERDNVTPAYLRALRVAVLNATAHLLTKDDATTTWVKEAAGDEKATTEAVTQVFTHRYGANAVAYDLADPQANAEAVLHGYTVVGGGAMSKGEWANAKRAGVMQPAGHVTPSNSAIETAADGKPPIPEHEWTPGMRRVAAYAQRLGSELLGYKPHVEVTRLPGQPFTAAFGSQRLILNLGRLGHQWFNEPDQQRVDELLIHEFAHDCVRDNHLAEAFHDELCRLGAKMRWVTAALTQDDD